MVPAKEIRSLMPIVRYPLSLMRKPMLIRPMVISPLANVMERIMLRNACLLAFGCKGVIVLPVVGSTKKISLIVSELFPTLREVHPNGEKLINPLLTGWKAGLIV